MRFAAWYAAMHAHCPGTSRLGCWRCESPAASHRQKSTRRDERVTIVRRHGPVHHLPLQRLHARVLLMSVRERAFAGHSVAITHAERSSKLALTALASPEQVTAASISSAASSSTDDRCRTWSARASWSSPTRAFARATSPVSCASRTGASRRFWAGQQRLIGIIVLSDVLGV